MPTEQDIGFEESEGIFPLLNASGEQDEAETIEWGETRFSDLTSKDDQWLAKPSIFSDEFGFAL